MNENTTKWLKTGFIDENLSELDKTMLASNLEEASVELLKCEGEPKLEIKAGLFLPIVVRLFKDKKLRVINDMSALYNNFQKFYNENFNKYTDGYYKMDDEAKFCSDYVEQYEV